MVYRHVKFRFPCTCFKVHDQVHMWDVHTKFKCTHVHVFDVHANFSS